MTDAEVPRLDTSDDSNIVPALNPVEPLIVPLGYLNRDGLDNLLPVQWLIENTLQARTASEIYGKYGVGKTVLSLDLALCIATGKPWHGRKVRQGRVVYVYAEGAEGLNRRVVAWEKRYYGGRRVPNDCILFRPVPVDLPNDKARAMLVADIHLWTPAAQPVLVVFDTVFQCAGDVDLNSGKEMKQLTDAVTDIRKEMPSAHVLLVHHDTKAGGSGGMGSVHLPGTLWSLFELVDQGGELQFKCHKQRNKRKELAHATFQMEEISLGTFGEDGEPEMAAVICKLHDGLPKVARAQSTISNEDLLKALGSFGTMGASSNKWKAASRSTGVKISNEAFAEMRAKLLGLGRVALIEGRYYLPVHTPQAGPPVDPGPLLGERTGRITCGGDPGDPGPVWD